MPNKTDIKFNPEKSLRKPNLTCYYHGLSDIIGINKYKRN